MPPKKLPVAITEEEYISLIKKTPTLKHKIAFMFGFESGMRISEVLKLEPRNIDLKEKNVFVQQGKGRKDRVVPLPKRFKETHLKLLPLKYKNISAGSRSLQQSFRRSAERSKLLETKPTAHFHSLRHGFATHSLDNGIPIHHVRNLMGHANISTTNVYAEMNPKEALKSYRELF